MKKNLIYTCFILSLNGFSQVAERKTIEVKTIDSLKNIQIAGSEIDLNNEITYQWMVEDISIIKNWEVLSDRISLINKSLLSNTVTDEQRVEFTHYKVQLLQAELNLISNQLIKNKGLLPIEKLTDEQRSVELELSDLNK